MKKWLLTASEDGNKIDFETIIEAETEPSFWRCYTIAGENGCNFFAIEEVIEYDRTTAERCKNIVEVLTPQEVADLMRKPVEADSTIYRPNEK